jgi:hypothetical protein
MRTLDMRNPDSDRRERTAGPASPPDVFSETAKGGRTGAPICPEGVLLSHSVTGSERLICDGLSADFICPLFNVEIGRRWWGLCYRAATALDSAAPGPHWL